MTPLMLHGITGIDAAPPTTAPDHLRLPVGQIVGLASPTVPSHLDDDGEPLLAEVRRHHELLTAYSTECDVLPVRFGAVFSGTDVLANSLLETGEAYVEALAALAGCVEYLLRVTVAPVAENAKTGSTLSTIDGGRGFLQQKRALRNDRRLATTRRLEFSTNLPAKLAAVRCMHPLESTSADVLVASALLVERRAVSEMMQSAEALAEEASETGLAISLRGPGPCYSFAEQTPDGSNGAASSVTGRENAHV